MNLYNKYRPIVFEDVLGQNCTNILRAQLSNNDMSSTYMLSGPSGTGKTTLARLIAMSLLCENRKKGEYNPCGNCSSCKQIIKDNNRDVMEINCATNGGVNEIRDMISERMLITPSTGDFRIFVMDESHMLTSQAQNALLKIMEEPPKYVKFFLCTTDVHKILNTIKTRCQHYALNKVPNKDIVELLQKIVQNESIDYDMDGINLIAQSANGSPRSAISLLDSISTIGATEENIRIALSRAPRQISINLLDAIRKQSRVEAYKIISAASAEGRDLPALLEESVRILVNEITRYKLLKEIPSEEEIANIAKDFSGAHIVDVSTRLLEINSKIRQNVPASLIIPVGILNVIDRFSKIKSDQEKK